MQCLQEAFSLLGNYKILSTVMNTLAQLPHTPQVGDSYEELLARHIMSNESAFPNVQSCCCLHCSYGSWRFAYWVYTVCTRPAERNCCISHYRMSGFGLQLKYLVYWLPTQNSFLSILSNYCYFFKGLKDVPVSLILSTSFSKKKTLFHEYQE